jgi:transcriptional regulator with XRE-family HTH domain
MNSDQKNQGHKKISQFKLMQMCSMQKASISRLEDRQSNPTLFTIHKIAEALEVPIAHFFA